jgi:uncharacterized protein YbbK (DUF523 family)
VQAPPPAPPISLSATASKVKGNRTTVLRWSGALGSQVTIYRSGSPSATMTQINDGAYTDSFGKGSGTFTYKVCETASPTTCSATVSVAF